MKMAGTDTTGVSATADEGMPERGRFQFWYSYSGESIDATIQVTKNGTIIGQQNGMSTVKNALLVDAQVQKGDVIVISSHFKESESSGRLTRDILFGHPAGLWYSFGNGAFYLQDQDGNIIEVFGTWDFSLTLTPPWNGIEVTGDPESISAGESSAISLQPYETPGEPVILPDVTYINLQTSFLGDLIGGLSLPEYGYRYTQGFSNAPWSLLKDTDILYEVHPSIEASDSFEIPVVAYSPYDTGINGSTAIEVKNEEELEISLTISGSKKAWPTLEGGDVQAYFNLNKVDNIIENIQVQVTKANGQPAPNELVEIEVFWITESGGHNHPNIPPKNEMGVFSVSLSAPLSPKEGKGLVTAKTDEDGKIYLKYTTPEFGGEVNLTATLQSASDKSDTKQVVSRVPGLVPMPEFEYYKKIGGTSAHHGPPGYSDDNNHWVNETVGAMLVSLSTIYNNSFPDFPNVRYNDISLSNGGLFDIFSEWESPHQLHRIGQNVDVRTYPPQPDGIPLGNIEDIRDMVKELDPNATVEEHGGEWTDEKGYHDTRHFHIDFEIF